MLSNDYEVVFDILGSPFQWWMDTIPAAILGVVGCFVFALGSLRGRLLGGGVALLAIAWLTFVISANWAEYRKLRLALADGEYEDLQGPVLDFVPDDAGGHTPQTFSIANRRFEIWATETTSSFRQTVRRGGPNLSGRCVRALVTSDKQILWLGIRRSGCDVDTDAK